MSIERVFVAGAGLMGHGIAQVHATIGKQVALYEPELARAEAGRARIAGNLDRAVAKGRITGADRDAILERLAPTADLAGAAAADLVVEAVFEDVDVKTRLWEALDRMAPAHALDRHRSTGRGGWRGTADTLCRHALLQPCAGHAPDRAHSRLRD
jgi:3-hydroxybutyryl-CoA dehydrogenase